MIYEWSKCYLEDHAIYSMPYKHGRREYEEGATTFRLPSNFLWMKQILVIYQKLAGTVIFMPCVGEKKIHAMPSVLTIRDRVDSTSVLQEPFILRCASMDTETG